MGINGTERQTPQSLKPVKEKGLVGGQTIFWKFVVPLSATILFTGCANNKPTTKGVEATKMPYGEVIVPERVDMDTLRLKPAKTEGKEMRNFLLRDRLRTLQKQMEDFLPKTPERGRSVFTDSTDVKKIAKELRFITIEGAMCDSALKGDMPSVEKYKTELLKFGEEVGEKGRAEEIIRNFNRIMNAK